MRISILIYNYFPFGGQQRDFLRIANECISRGHEVRVFTRQWEGPKPSRLHVDVLAQASSSRLAQYRQFNEEALALIASEPRHPVLGFSAMPGLDAYFAADPCFAHKARYRRGLYYRLTPRYRHFSRYEDSVFGSASTTRIFTLSALQEREYLEFYPDCAERITRLPAGIAPDRKGASLEPGVRERIRHDLSVAGDEFLVIQVGSGFRVKGVDRALRAVASLPPQLRQRVRYLLVGQDKPARFRALAKRLGIADRFTCLPGTENIVELYQAADLMLHPAYRESAGYVLLEAAVNGLPVLTTASCGYADEIGQHNLGRVCDDPFSQAQLESELAFMLENLAHQPWSDNGVEYGQQAELFRMAGTVVDHLEQLGQSITDGGT